MRTVSFSIPRSIPTVLTTSKSVKKPPPRRVDYHLYDKIVCRRGRITAYSTLRLMGGMWRVLALADPRFAAAEPRLACDPDGIRAFGGLC